MKDLMCITNVFQNEFLCLQLSLKGQNQFSSSFLLYGAHTFIHSLFKKIDRLWYIYMLLLLLLLLLLSLYGNIYSTP